MSLGEELPKQISRVTDILVEYNKIPDGAFTAARMKRDLDIAIRALAEGDIVQMLVSNEALKQYEL